MLKKYKAPSTFCPCNHDPLDLSNLVVYISKFIPVTTFSFPLSISWLQISQNPAVTGWHQLQQKWISLGTEEVFAGVRDWVGVLAGVWGWCRDRHQLPHSGRRSVVGLVGWDFSSNWCLSQPGLFRLFSQLDLERRWVCHQLAWKLIFFSIVDDFFSTVCFTEVFVDDFVHFVFHRGVCWWFCALCVSHCWVQRTTGALSWKLLLSWGHFWSFSFHFIHFTSELCSRYFGTFFTIKQTIFCFSSEKK